MKVANKWKNCLSAQNHYNDFPPLIYNIYTRNYLNQPRSNFYYMNDIICYGFVMIVDIQLKLIIKNITLCKMSKSMVLVLIDLWGQTKNGRPFELMCITRNMSIIYQLYANVSSLSLYNLIMCHIVSFDFYPSLERQAVFSPAAALDTCGPLGRLMVI